MNSCHNYYIHTCYIHSKEGLVILRGLVNKWAWW